MDTLYTSRLHGFPTTNRTSLAPNLTEESALSLLIVLGSSLSLVALVFAFITYSLFSDLRNLSGTTLMNLLSALFMTQLLYVVNVGGIGEPQLCVALASALHYVRLCVFMWMSLMTHHMYVQYETGLHLVPVTDSNIGRNFVRYSVLGWGIPAVFLLIGLLIQAYERHGVLLDTPSGFSSENCWFLDKNAVIYGLILPCCLIAAVTFFYLFRSAMISRYIVCMQPKKRVRDRMGRKSTLQIILFVKITIVLCICLALATAIKLTNSDAVWFAFHLVQGLQGILISTLVTCNCQVLKLYTKSMKPRATAHIPSYVTRKPSSSSSTSGLNRSTSMQLLTWDPPPDVV